MRLSEQEYAAMMKKSNCRESGKRKNPRVNRRKVRLDGHEFDSRKEAEIYFELKHDPNVEILELQPKFILQGGFSRGKKRLRAITYTADFLIREDGRKIVVEVKSTGTLKANSKSYPIRKKLFLHKFPELGFREIIFRGKKRAVKEYF